MIIKIILLYSFINSGDVGNANSVFAHLQSELGNSTIERINIDVSGSEEEIVAQFAAHQNDNSNVIYSVGNYGLQAIKILKNSGLIKKDDLIAQSIHQYNSILDDILLDYLAMPKSALFKISNPKKQYGLVRSLFAMPTDNPSISDLEVIYRKWTVENKPLLDDKYIIVTLPGDAPNEDGEMQLFTKESAEELLQNVIMLWKQNNKTHKVIVQNGPRTGKFSSRHNAEIIGDHTIQEGQDPNLAIDRISKFFTQRLDDLGVPHQFFNFAFEITGNGRKVHSVFKPLLYLLSSSAESFFILPGESVSMLGQIPLYATSDRIIVFKPSAMNKAHAAVFQQAFANNYVSYFTNSGIVQTPDIISKRTDDDALLIAKDIAQLLRG